jgi:osmoprotectant transport system substrate-binding protein
MAKFFRLLAFVALAGAASPLSAQVVVGSKIDTEGNLLGNMIRLVLENAGIAVENRVPLGATPIVRQAIVSGEVDLYPEYTGNAAFFFNQADAAVWRDFEAGYTEAKRLDYEANKIVWLTPAPANNTWGIAVRNEVAEANNLNTMSEFGAYIAGGGAIKLAASAEFVNSAPALPAFQTAYGFTLASGQLVVLAGGDTAATVLAAADQIDGTNAAMVYGTDGAIAEIGLRVMTDDRNVQPVYAPTPIIREEVLTEHPEIAELLRPVFEGLDLVTLQELNGRIAVGGEAPATVAEEYLRSHQFLN